MSIRVGQTFESSFRSILLRAWIQSENSSCRWISTCRVQSCSYSTHLMAPDDNGLLPATKNPRLKSHPRRPSGIHPLPVIDWVLE